jgi:hypothetical protein
MSKIRLVAKLNSTESCYVKVVRRYYSDRLNIIAVPYNIMGLHIALLPLISLFVVVGIMGSFVSSTQVVGTSGNATTAAPSSSLNNASSMQSTVNFPTREEVAAYNMELGSEINKISNSSQGNATEVKAASKGNETFVVWLGKIDELNHVFFSVTRDRGANYTQPVELSPSDGGNASNLQLAVYDSIVDVVWQSTNLTSGRSNIIGSASMDNGLTFKTYQLNAEGTNAIDPVLPGNFIVVWRQGEDCPPPPPPPPDGVENLSTTTAITNSTATDGSQQSGGIDDDTCAVYARFRW